MNKKDAYPHKSRLSAQLDMARFRKLTDTEKAQQEVMGTSTTFFRDGLGRLVRNPLAVISLVLLAVIFMVFLVFIFFSSCCLRDNAYTIAQNFYLSIFF